MFAVLRKIADEAMSLNGKHPLAMVLRSECKSEAEFVEKSLRQVSTASPRAAYYIQLRRGRARALVLAMSEAIPYKVGYTYELAKDWLSPKETS